MSVYQFSFCNARGLRIQFIHTRAGIFSPIIFFGMDNLFRGYTIAAIAYGDNGFGYINVGDGCGIKLMLVTNFRCWCSNWDVYDLLIWKRQQHNDSVTNITVSNFWMLLRTIQNGDRCWNVIVFKRVSV